MKTLLPTEADRAGDFVSRVSLACEAIALLWALSMFAVAALL